MRTEDYILRENSYGAHNYHPLPVVLQKGKGVFIWDTNGQHYFDFLSGYSALNQGHCHPHIIQALHKQAEQLTLVSRAFYSDKLGEFMEFACKLFGYDKLLPMNTGAEAVETALKLARRWGYRCKGIPSGKTKIVVCKNNFYGRTITIISMSSDPSTYTEYDPYTPGFIQISYNSVQALQEIAANPDIAGFLVEPIQGEAGIIVPDDGYLKQCKEICEKNNILFMADEIQTGIGCTGKMLACDHEQVRPDILILGKALSGGTIPVSAVLADDEIIFTIGPGEYGSTYGGNPLAAQVGIAALEVIQQENLIANAYEMGIIFREEIQKIESPMIREVRGKGLLNAIVTTPVKEKTAWDICMMMKEKGLIAKPTHEHIIRFTPPLIITEEQLREAIHIIQETFEQMPL